MVYPAGTARERVERVAAALLKIVRSPEIGEKFLGLGAFPRTAGPSEFRTFLHSEYSRWGAIVKASGAKVD
jgi:tripartite-type tricarboxylate transporter receptor subunit TctC